MAAAKEVAFLRFILQASKKQQSWILNNLTRDQLNAIGECCYQLLYGDRDVSRLKKQSAIIRKIGDKLEPASKRQRLVRRRKRVVLKVLEIVLEKGAAHTDEQTEISIKGKPKSLKGPPGLLASRWLPWT